MLFEILHDKVATPLKAGVHQMNANFDEVGGLINVVVTLQKSNKFENGIPTVIKSFPAHI